MEKSSGIQPGALGTQGKKVGFSLRETLVFYSKQFYDKTVVFYSKPIFSDVETLKFDEFAVRFFKNSWPSITSPEILPESGFLIWGGLLF